MDRKTKIILITKTNSKCFQYVITVALSHEKIKDRLERMTKTKPFVSNYCWKGISYLSEKEDWKNLKQIIWQLREEQVISLMIPNNCIVSP